MLCLHSVKDAGKCSVHKHSQWLCAYPPTHLGSFTALQYFLGRVWWWAAHIVMATKHMHIHLIRQQKQRWLLGYSIQSESLRGEPAIPITRRPLRAFVSIVIRQYLLVHVPADSFSTKCLTFLLTPVVWANLAEETYIHITTPLPCWASAHGKPLGKPWNICLLGKH